MKYEVTDNEIFTGPTVGDFSYCSECRRWEVTWKMHIIKLTPPYKMRLCSDDCVADYSARRLVMNDER